ncbi:unnamed protein product [Rhizophagus irregularis]|nr:unnamed protein product [Rhizophagus irregularis]CAG8681168.1 12973_t:CDS:2 [Rhizophagus irregularis]
MLLPPPAIYNSANELFHNAQTFANSQGYALVKKKTLSYIVIKMRDPFGFELMDQRVLFAINLDIILVLIN